MNVNLKRAVFLAMWLMVTAACSIQGRASDQPILVTSFAVTPEIVPLTPVTPLPPKQGVTYGSLRISMDDYQFSDEYATTFERKETPSKTEKFLWVYVAVKNTGTVEERIPYFDQFKLIYKGIPIDATRSYRKDFPDYANQNFLYDRIHPAQSREGWLRYTVPISAGLSDFLFEYGSLSYPVSISGTLFISKDQRIYVWRLIP